MWGLMRVKAAVKIELKTFLYNIYNNKFILDYFLICSYFIEEKWFI